MKKIMMTLAVVCAAFLISCGVESKAKGYAQDYADALGDEKKLEKLDKEIENYIEDLSPEDKMEFTKIFFEELAKIEE